MIDKSLFRSTEKKLYNYFSKDKKMNSIKNKIELLTKQIAEIDRKIKETDIHIPEESRAITYEERVQSSGDGTSYAEKAAIRIIESLEREKANKHEEIAALEAELRTIEADCSVIGSNINLLDKESINFLKIKYGRHLSDWEVGIEVGLSQSSAYRKRCDLIEDVARWEDWLNRKS